MNLTQANEWLAACSEKTEEPETAQKVFAVVDCGTVRFIGVAGTAGKTAVAAMECAILSAAGFRCGRYAAGTAPLRERITVSGKPISAEAFTKTVEKLQALDISLARQTTELATAAACFALEHCDFAVMEFTDTLPARFFPNMPACAVTQIGQDGTGHTLERTAALAAGILRKGCAAVTAPSQPKAALTEIIVAAGKVGAELTVPEAENLEARKARRLENRMDYGGYEQTLPLIGRPAAENAAIAVELALALWRKGFAISDEAILQGMPSAPLVCGVHLLRRRPYVLADPCHLPVQVSALAGVLHRAEFEHISVIAGLSGCKDMEAFFTALENGFISEADKTEKNQLPGMSDNAVDKVYLVTPDGPDAVKAEEALAVARFHFDAEVCADLTEAAKRARADGNEGIVVLGGAPICRQAGKHFLPRH